MKNHKSEANKQQAPTPVGSGDLLGHTADFPSINAIIKNDGTVTITTTQTALKLNSVFEPSGFLTMCGYAGGGTNALVAAKAFGKT
jgi:hypothetical protein